MYRRLLTFIPALIAGIALPVEASSVVCQIAPGSSQIFTTTACSQEFTPTAFLDWGSPINGTLSGAGTNLGGLGVAMNTASGGPFPETVGTNLNAAVDGDAFTINSNDQLTRADNTALAWSGSNWIPAGFVDSTNNYFSGHFGAPTTPTSVPQFGDNLLGALAPGGGSNGNPQITLSFTNTLAYVAFQVSSASMANFNAELIAFDSSHNQIGVYQIQATGSGGNCAGLSNFGGPQPCNDAPLIQFFDPQNNIKSVELVMLGDLSGVYVDELQVASIPEPVSSTLFAIGLLSMLWAAKRRRQKLAKETLAP